MKPRLAKRILLLAFPALVFSACGVIPLPSQSLPDISVTATVPLTASDRTLYQDNNTFGSALPGSVKRVHVGGQLSISGSGARSLEFYVSNSPPAADCTPAGGFELCPDASSGSLIGTASVPEGQSVAVSLSGAALDNAAHSGKGYLGIRLTSGTLLTGDTLKFQQLRAGAYF